MIRVVDYDPDWPVAYSDEARNVSKAAGNTLLRIHHIGSTSIPGIKAKPVIDILLEVESVEALDERTMEFQALGYEVMGEFGIPGRRYYRRDNDSGVRTHQIHAFKAGAPDVVRHLAFRDYMRSHPTVASQYGELKARLAKEHSHGMGAYTDGKDSFVKEHERLALQWMAERLRGSTG